MRIRYLNEYHYRNEAFERYRYEFSQYLQKKIKDKDDLRHLLEENKESTKKSIKSLVCKLSKEIMSSGSVGKKKLNDILNKSTSMYKTPLYRKACFSLDKDNCQNDPHCVRENGKCKLVNLPGIHMEDRLLDLLYRYPVQREEILQGRVPVIDPTQELLTAEVGEVLLTGNKLDVQFEKLFSREQNTIFLEQFPDIDTSQPTFEGVDKQKYLKFSSEKQAEVQTYSLAMMSTHWAHILGPWYRLISPIDPCNSLFYAMAQIAQVLAVRRKEIEPENKEEVKNNKINAIEEEENGELPDLKNITVSTIREIYANFLLQVTKKQVENIAKAVESIPPSAEEKGWIDVADFYNHYQDQEQVESVDDLARRIVNSQSSYIPSLFDVIFLSLMLNIHIVLLKKATSENIGNGFVGSAEYAVLFYEYTPQLQNNCIRFYLVQKGGRALVSGQDSTIKRLLMV